MKDRHGSQGVIVSGILAGPSIGHDVQPDLHHTGLSRQILRLGGHAVEGSQNTYYFGYKLHALCGLSGVIHSYDLSKASVADLHYMKDVKHTYHDCSIYGDKGYIGADVQLDLFETAHIRLECPYRLNQKDWKPTFIPFAKARKRIETIFSQLTDQFLVIRNYAKITNGLFARIIGKISALTILQYVNFINDKPIGRIKYALN